MKNATFSPGSAVWRKRSARTELTIFAGWVLALAFVSWTFQVMTQDTIWAFVVDAPAQAQDIGSRMMPPAWACWQHSASRVKAGRAQVLICI